MEFLSYLISGISLGSIYAIIALGYTMVYGIAKMLNFAHGDIIMIGGYVSFCSMYYLNLPPIVATLLAVIACTVLGIVIERLAYAPLRSAPSLAVLITAIGVSYFLQNSALLIWKAAAKTYPPVVAGAVQLFNGQLTISYISLLTIAACIVIMLALTTFVSKSKMGKAMRACSEDKGAAQLGHQRQLHHFRNLCHRLRSGGHRRCAAVLLQHLSDAHHRLHARHQGVHRRRVRRHRLYPRRISGRPAAGHHRSPGQGLYFHPAGKLHRFRRSDRGPAGEAGRSAGQDRARESVR